VAWSCHSWPPSGCSPTAGAFRPACWRRSRARRATTCGSISRGHCWMWGLTGNSLSCVFAVLVGWRIRTSDCDRLMLRFYHIGGYIQRSPQQTERINSHSRWRSLAKDATDSGIQHPSRYFKRRSLRVLADATGKHDRSAPVSLSMDRYLLSVERMPRVKHFVRFGFMGFASLGCSTSKGRTARWRIARRKPFESCIFSGQRSAPPS